MAEVAEWRALDSRALDSREWNQPSSEDIEGISITAYVSPYDVPEEIHVYVTPNDEHYKLEFRYIGGEEATKSETGYGQVKLRLGRHSRRLYGIEFDARQAETGGVSEAIDELSGESRTPPRTGNYKLVKEVVSSLFATPDGPLADSLARLP